MVAGGDVGACNKNPSKEVGYEEEICLWVWGALNLLALFSGECPRNVFNTKITITGWEEWP